MLKDLDARFKDGLFWCIAAAIGIKFLLFLHLLFVDSAAVMQTDSFGYLKDAKGWEQFFLKPSEGLEHSLFRTPGYPFFLYLTHLVLGLPIISIVFLQIILNILTGSLIYKTALLIDKRIALLGCLILLLDVPTTIYSSMILTESLHLCVLSMSVYAFIRYIKDKGMGWLIWASVFLMVSVLIRPVGYFLGFALAGFIIYIWGAKSIRTGLTHALILLTIVYAFLGIWQYRNFKVYNKFTVSSIDKVSIGMHGVIGRYARETDPQLRAMPPVLYYVHSVGRNFLDLMVTPGNMKYFKSKGWKLFGAVFGYLFVVFWWIGLIAALRQLRWDPAKQFLALILLYFISVSLVSTGWLVTPRFRVPMMPAIAILSACGWMALFYDRSFKRIKA